MDYSQLPSNNVICIDMKSFYASCECVLMGLNPLTTMLAVVGDISRTGSVVLAASPLLKKQYGIKTGSRLYEINNISDPNIYVVQARMGEYFKIAKRITELFEEFVPPQAIHIYSVDESWLTLDGTEKLHGVPRVASLKLMDRILEETGIPSAVGIGDNKFLAKTALDNFAKKTGLAEVRYEQVKTMLHPLPIDKMWGVGSRLREHFHALGIRTYGDLACAPLEEIKKRFGKAGEQLYWYSWGVDLSPVFYDENSPPPSVFGFSFEENLTPVKSVGRGVTLLSDYIKSEDILLVVRDLIDEVCEILREHKKVSKTIHLSIGYSKNSKQKGFSRQKSIKLHTNDVIEIYEICSFLFHKFHVFGEPVRQINVSAGKLVNETERVILDEKMLKRRAIAKVTDDINRKYGKGAITKASALKQESIVQGRTKKIKGHYK
ncbi:UV damage repair protein UvrX [Priestia megaterium]|nr:UV damage repair protein UvrX [Priestia megaterium]